jgi:hypothetical protein
MMWIIRDAEAMKHAPKPDLSGAYGDRDDTLSWPALILLVGYSVTIGLVSVLARFLWLVATSAVSRVRQRYKETRVGSREVGRRVKISTKRLINNLHSSP